MVEFDTSHVLFFSGNNFCLVVYGLRNGLCMICRVCSKVFDCGLYNSQINCETGPDEW